MASRHVDPEKRRAYYRDYNRKRREQLNEYMKQHQETPEGVLKRIYSSQCFHSRNRGHQPPSYTWKQLIDRYVDDPQYIQLYDNWVASGKSRWEKPSLDRIDGSKGYSFDNIIMTTWRENQQRQIESLKKSVAIFEGEKLVNLCGSRAEAAKFLGYKRHFPRDLVDSNKRTMTGHTLVSIPPALLKLISLRARATA